MDKIEVVYRDIKISYREDTEYWGCNIDNGKWSEKQTLKECKKLIDLFYKKQVENTVCVNLNNSSWGSKFGSKLIITSVSENGDVWVKSEKGEREKMSKKSAEITLALWNDTNLRIVEEYKNQLKVIELEKQKADNILSKIERVSFGNTESD